MAARGWYICAVELSAREEFLSMTDEERQRTMDFILQTQAQLTVNDQTHDGRLSRLERIAGLMVGAGLRERKTRSAEDQRLTKALTELAEQHKRTEASIAHTDKRLDALVDIVRRQHNGGQNSRDKKKKK